MPLKKFPIYRAEAFTKAIQAGEAKRPRETMRLPSNVPYFVDNLWEFLRPDGFPCRRHALYASPTRALAQKNRSGRDQGLGFCVYQLAVNGSALVAHLQVPDAREHKDIKEAQKLVQSFAQDWTSACAEEKPLIALLFLPGATRADWEHAGTALPLAARLIREATALSTFWQDASTVPNASNGELFLQLAPGASYTPVDIERYVLD